VRRLVFLLSTLFLIANVSTQAQSSSNSYSLNQVITPLKNAATGDFNGDGKLDFATLSLCQGLIPTQILTYMGRGDGFPGVRPAPIPSGCLNASGGATGDFNGDQKADVAFIALSSDSNNVIDYALGNGDGTFQTLQSLAFPILPMPPGSSPGGNTYPVAIYTADFNHDGYADILVTDNVLDYVIYLADTHGGFAAPIVTINNIYPFNAPIPIPQVSIGDVNHDGNPDLILPNSAGIQVELGQGNGSFTAGAGLSYPFQPLASGQVADLDGNGNLDVLVFDSGSASFLFFSGDGTGAFQTPGQALLPVHPENNSGSSGVQAYDVLLDINGDGLLDLVFYSNGSLYWAQGNGNGTFKQESFLTSSFNPNPYLQGIHLTTGGNPAILDASGILYLPATAMSAMNINSFYLDLGSVNYESLATATGNPAQLSLTSVGADALTISAVQAQAPLQENDNCLGSLPPGAASSLASCNISIQLFSADIGPYSGNISITSNASASPISVPVFATVVAPPFTASPTSLDFGYQKIGTSTTQQITFTSVSSQPDPIAYILLSGGFTYSTSCRGQLVSTCTVDVTFTPTATGVSTGSIKLADENGFSASVSLTGQGVQTGPLASTSPSAVAFGNQTIGTTGAIQTVTLSNTGDAPLEIQSISASGGFSSTNNCGPSIAPGASCALMVAFAPTTVGSQTGAVSIADNASNSPQAIALSGTGTAVPVAQLSITPSSLTFNSLVGTASGPQIVTVANVGGAAAQIQSVTASDGFSALSACSGTIIPGSSCTIDVSFTPSGTSSQTGALTIQDNAPGSPQTVQLSGAGTSLAVSAASGSSTSATINAGQTATYSLMVTAIGGFTGTLTVSCTGAPAGMQCIGSPATLAITGNSPVAVTYTVGPAASAANASMLKVFAAPITLAFLFGLLPGPLRKSGRRLSCWPVILLACALLLTASACGGGSTTNIIENQQGTTYVMNAVLTTSSGQQIQQPLVLTVNSSAK
jgi:hypothetical protein